MADFQLFNFQHVRPEFEVKVKHKKKNPITQVRNTLLLNGKHIYSWICILLLITQLGIESSVLYTVRW